MGRFEGKVALITGGGRGIGKATALAFGREGAKVVIGNRDAAAADKVIRQINHAGGEATFLATDVRNADDIKALVDHAMTTFGRLDIAFNNAGVEGIVAPTIEQTDENYQAVMDVNVRGVWLSMKYEIPAMLDDGGGAIINNASIAGTIGFAGTSIYVASKHAVLGLTKSAALEYARHGIRINAVSPAGIETEMFDRFTGHSLEAKQGFANSHPIGRMGSPEEVAKAVLWLSSDDSSFVVGHGLMVDGGYTIQ